MESLKISDYMNRHPVTFTTDMTVAQAVELFLKAKQIGGPVIDEHRHVIGFLSEQDCLKKMIEATYLNEYHEVVGDIMHLEPLTVHANGSVLDIAQQMTHAKPKIYPILDENEQLIGVINRSDVLRAIDNQLKSMYEKGHTRMV
ncbi:CBS domain-containing protein [Shewanella sp. AS16]|uniref:CBS domain-containing protein n=1 Tax=Shewanella sp. AS16 TaxID=2907625 RepID=UPI001F436120|nr:CBS domain-containing protein [Shewanella sp. AS16]MCE9687717.1 CBS domain-containing protein [Shewanella sp. AS16]